MKNNRYSSMIAAALLLASFVAHAQTSPTVPAAAQSKLTVKFKWVGFSSIKALNLKKIMVMPFYKMAVVDFFLNVH